MIYRQQTTLPILLLIFLAATAVAADQKRVAVLEFDNRADLSEYELRTLTDKVRRAALGTLPKSQYRIITRENILEMLPQGTTLADCEGGECEVQIGRLVGAQLVVSGEVGYFGNQLQVNLKMPQPISRIIAQTTAMSGFIFADI